MAEKTVELARGQTIRELYYTSRESEEGACPASLRNKHKHRFHKLKTSSSFLPLSYKDMEIQRFGVSNGVLIKLKKGKKNQHLQANKRKVPFIRKM